MATKDSRHAHAAMLHAIQRAQERYGLRLTEEKYRWLCNRLRASIGRCLGVEAKGNEVWVVRARQRLELIAVYDRALNRILTFLPEGARVDFIQRRAG